MGQWVRLIKPRQCPFISFDFATLANSSFEPRREKTGLRGFRPGQTQTGLYKLRKELEA